LIARLFFLSLSLELVLKLSLKIHALKEWGLAESEGEGRERVESGGGKETGKKDERKETAETVLHNLTFSGPLGRIFEGQLYQLLQLSL